MSWVKIWVHMVFTTKYRTPYLATPDLRDAMFRHIKQNAREKNIWLDCVNGYSEHAHCLISLGREQTICDVAQLIKGESSFWMNKQGLLDQPFIWQDDYWAVGVSESHMQRVRKYIHNQEEHHKKVTFKHEIERFEQKHGWKRIPGTSSRSGSRSGSTSR